MDIALFRFCHSRNISVSAPIYHAEFINNCAKLNDNPLHTIKVWDLKVSNFYKDRQASPGIPFAYYIQHDNLMYGDGFLTNAKNC